MNARMSKEHIVVSISPYYRGFGWVDAATNISFKPNHGKIERVVIDKSKDLTGIMRAIQLNQLILLEGEVDLGTLPPADGGIEDLKLQIQQLTTQLNAKDSEIAELTSSKTNLEEQVATLQGEVSALTLSNAGLEEQVTTLEGEVSGLTLSKTNLEGQVATLQGEVSELTSSNADLEGQVATLEAEVERLEQELAALGEEVVPASMSIPEGELLTEAELNELTKDEIKALLDARSISYTTADTKAVLIDLYLGRA